MLLPRRAIVLSLLLFTAVVTPRALQQAAPSAPPRAAAPRPAPELTLAPTATELPFREALVVGLVGSYARSAVPSDILLWQLADGSFREPREGDVVGPDGRGRTQTWSRLEAGENGWFQNRALSNAYLFFTVVSARARTMILDASGFYVARINGEPRGGEKYGTETVRHPVRLRAGRNAFLFQVERGRFRGRLLEPAAPLAFTEVDATLPDLIVGQTTKAWAGIRLVNATEETIDSLQLAYTVGGRAGTAALATTVSPLTTRKLAIPIELTAPVSEGAITLVVRGVARAGAKTVEIRQSELALKAVAPTAHHARTFVSESDGSVQYYGVAPWTGAGGGPAAAGAQKPALVLSLHGAGVEAAGQARAYKPKDWAWIVAATNRRPYGFDWEDWGRLDAMEVLANAQRDFGTDPARTYLTGHSMGGHGTWHVGATLPDTWAAIAPSAGWHSFSSYGGGPTYKDPTPIEKMLVRANHPGETMNLTRNLLHYGVYVLHGDKDDNVPVAQARAMREVLGTFHPDFTYYERPGAGHWWGDECVDWPPLFDFLEARRRQPDASVTRVEFVTANPGVSSVSRWLAIVGQVHPLEYSRVAVDRDPKTGSVKGTTENVSRLAFALPAPLTVELDGSTVQATAGPDGRVHLERTESGLWQAAGPPDLRWKGPHRGGGFKDAFRHRVVLVYGTRGTPDENARAYQKARYDAETFWYRGNGSLEVVADKAFDPAKAKDRNVVLYGNADTNACWNALLGGGPVVVANGRARVGDHEFTGADIGAYFVRPRPDSTETSVGAVAWTGPAGWLAAGPVQYFVSGAGFPDLLLFSAGMLRTGTAGVRAIGWFGSDWSVERGEFAWQ